jgi:hypothetical protein
MSKPGDWMEDKQTLANGVHAALSYSILLTTAFLAHASWRWIGGIEAFLVVFVTVKEAWYDLKYETGETWQSSLEDAIGWLVGNILAWGVIGLAYWLGVWP